MCHTVSVIKRKLFKFCKASQILGSNIKSWVIIDVFVFPFRFRNLTKPGFP